MGAIVSPAEDGPTHKMAERWRLLVADDSMVERRPLAELLRTSGYDVDEAADGKSVMLMLESRPVDLLLLDLRMPMADGFDVLTFLQRTRPKLPVILMSGLAADEIQDSMNRLPVHELPTLLLKPINPEQLLDLVDLRLRGELPG